MRRRSTARTGPRWDAARRSWACSRSECGGPCGGGTGSRRPPARGEALAGDHGNQKLAAPQRARAVRHRNPGALQAEAATVRVAADRPRLHLRRPGQRGCLLDRLASPGTAGQRRSNGARSGDRANAPARKPHRRATGVARPRPRCGSCRHGVRQGSRTSRHSRGGRRQEHDRRRRLDLLWSGLALRRRGANRERAEDARHVSHGDSDGAARPRVHREPDRVSRPAAVPASGRGRLSRRLAGGVRGGPPQARSRRASLRVSLRL